MLQEKISENIDRLYDLTNRIKEQESRISALELESDDKTMMTMFEMLDEYIGVVEEAKYLLTEYFKEEKENKVPVNLNYHRLYKKLLIA